MDKHGVALVLAEIATLLELHGENRFKVRAYSAAARAVEGVEGDLAELVEAGAIGEVRGIGPATESVVVELVRRGASAYHEALLEKTPAGFFGLLAIPGLGPGRIHRLHQELGVSDVADLERAARAGEVARIKGFGDKTQAAILEGIGFVRGVSARRLQTGAYEAAARLLGILEGRPGVGEVKLAGELRRRLETADGVDVLAEVEGACDELLEAFLALPGTSTAERSGPASATAALADGFELRVRCVAPGELPAAWVHATGSDAHLRELVERAASRGMELRPDGLLRDGEPLSLEDEAALYGELGLAWIPPELREGMGEVAAAASGELPELVDYDDLRGCFHNHTTFSDGAATLVEMAEAALERGWRYLGIADHSQLASYAGGLTPERIRLQHEEIDAWNQARGQELWLFKGIEADILADGRLDYADEEDDVLASMDYVVGSVHSSFRLSERDQTRRVLRALEDPRLTFLGHATGRLLLRRDGYRLDLEAVLEAAAERGVALEINANPRRLELDWRWWPRARELGILTAINPDAHSTRELDNVQHGIGVARKGWLGTSDVVNAWELDRVTSYFGERRP